MAILKRTSIIFCVMWCIYGLVACKTSPAEQKTISGLLPAHFQILVNNKRTDLYILKNKAGAEVCITNYGGRIVSLMVPDKDKKMQDVVLGFDNIEDYISIPSSFGATIGRFANRIANGQFVLDDDTITLDLNNGKHTIHGGKEGWQSQVFDAEQPADTVLVLRYVSADGESGFPGEVQVKVIFRLSNDNALRIDYLAETSKKTIINMTNHSFFNLSGNPENTIVDHILYVDADKYTPLNEELITTGEFVEVSNSPFDFRAAVSVDHALHTDTAHIQLKLAHGLDHNYVLNKPGHLERVYANLYSPKSGISLSIATTEPGMQVYSGNMLDGSRHGKQGISYHKRSGICLEPQHFPDSPNKSSWPSTVLLPGQKYSSSTIYRFAVQK